MEGAYIFFLSAGIDSAIAVPNLTPSYWQYLPSTPGTTFEGGPMVTIGGPDGLFEYPRWGGLLGSTTRTLRLTLDSGQG